MEVLIGVCWFLVNLNAEITVFFNFDFQEGQAVSFYIRLCEFYIWNCIVDVGWECLQLSCFNLDLSVIQISESVAWDDAWEGREGSLFFYIDLMCRQVGVIFCCCPIVANLYMEEVEVLSDARGTYFLWWCHSPTIVNTRSLVDCKHTSITRCLAQLRSPQGQHTQLSRRPAAWGCAPNTNHAGQPQWSDHGIPATGPGWSTLAEHLLKSNDRRLPHKRENAAQNSKGS